MSKRAERLRLQRMVAPRLLPIRLENPEEPRRAQRVLSISVYDDQAAAIERTVRQLRRAGYRHASRSFVIQAALQQLQHDLKDKTFQEVVNFFAAHPVRRPSAAAPSRRRQSRLKASGSEE